MSEFLKKLIPIFYLNSQSIHSNVFISIGIILLIISFFLFGFISLYRKVSDFKKQVLKIKEILKDVNQYNIDIKFEDINLKLQNISLISDVWREFTETILRIKDESSNQIKLFNIVNSNAYFNEENLTKKINIDFYKSIPSILTGFGILGTFLGIMFGLSKINLGTSDINQLKSGIEHLLAGTSTAFSTSIWGILCSIIFIFAKRTFLNQISNGILEIQNSIDKVFVQQKSEHFLSKILNESQQQTKELKQFNAEIAKEIANALGDKLIDNINPSIKELNKSINDLREDLKNIFEEQKQTNKESLEKINETMKNISENAASSISDKVNAVIKSDLENFVEILQELNSQISSIPETLEKQNNILNDSLSKFHEIIMNLEDTIKNSSNLMDKSKEIINNFENTIDKYKEITTSMEKKVDYINNAINRVELLNKQFVGLINYNNEQSQKFIKLMNDSVDNFTKISEATLQAWKAYENNFKNIKEDLIETFDVLRDGLTEYSTTLDRNLTETLEKFDNYLGNAVNNLNNFVSQLTNVLEEFIENMEELMKR